MGKINTFFNKLAFTIKKNSPEILTTVGIIGVVASAVIACVATTKVEDILKEHNEQIDTLKKCKDDQKDVYYEKDYKKDTIRTYIHTGAELAKIYAPALILGGLSIGSLIASNRQLRKRTVALTAAYMVVDSGFKEYRKNVIEKYGEEVDKELKYGIKTETIKETIVDENGKKKTIKSEVTTVDVSKFDPTKYSSYARIFDVGCDGWDPDPSLSLNSLKSKEKYWNHILQTRGWVFLNEVYADLGFSRTYAGQIVGWVKDNPNGDGFIDFGIYNLNDRAKRNFVNGFESSIILDFNVDGNILDLNPFKGSDGIG